MVDSRQTSFEEVLYFQDVKARRKTVISQPATFLQNAFFSFDSGCGPRRDRASATRLPPIQMKKRFEEDLALKNHVAKSQGIYLESGLMDA